MCSFKNPFQWISILVPFFISTYLVLDFGLLPIFFTSLVLIFSTLLFKFSKKNPIFLEKPVEDDDETRTHELIEISSQNNENEAQEGEVSQILDYLVRSENSFSDSSTTSDDSDEIDSGNVDRSPDCSDYGSISDEESLIEIALSSGHYVGPKETEQPKCNLQHKFQNFRQHSLMELLAEINEMNEEENLIEIDISMGSIKCSRFEIEA